MTSATDTLRKEHDTILRMLDAAEEVALQLDRGERVPPEVLAGLLEFFRLFADRCHHGKEEEMLFPILEKKGVPGTGGPLGVMLAEHQLGRALLERMAEAADAYESGGPEAGHCWSRAVRAYAVLLRGHIFKENEVLFVMAEGLLTDAEQALLAQGFEKVEEQRMGPGAHERLHALMDKLLGEIAAHS